MKFDKMPRISNKNLFGVILGLGLVVVIVVLVRYNNDKSSTKDNMSGRFAPMAYPDVSGTDGVSTEILSASTLNEGDYLPVSGINTTAPAPSCNSGSCVNPSDLLPKDINSEWASVNPASNDLKNLNMLSAGQLIGINTVGSSLRNPNLQERSEPVIPKTTIGPWNQSTIEADTLRRPLEIGSD